MQNSIFKDEILKAPNVASVPFYSPFRYPGGKTWLYPFAKKWMLTKNSDVLVEPFAGGGYVSLIGAIEQLVKQVVMVELDENVASVWRTILNHADWLCEQILTLDLTHENVDEVLAKLEASDKDKGFATLLMNRIYRGGILAPGSGRLKHGENGKGISSRWYPETLVERIVKIKKVGNTIDFIEGDAFDTISRHSHDENVLLFVDPPYPKAGRRLYTHSEIDHERLFQSLNDVEGDFLLTYEDSDQIMDLVNKFDFQYDKVLMSTTHHRKKFELLISNDISWLRE